MIKPNSNQTGGIQVQWIVTQDCHNKPGKTYLTIIGVWVILTNRDITFKTQ